MGSSSSKAAQGAARKFPTRAPGAVPPPSSAARTAHAAPPTQPAQARSQAKTATLKPEDLTANTTTTTNPEVTAEFSSRLRQMGIVQPNPTFSSTSTASPGPGPGPSPHADLIQNPGPLFPSTSRNATLGTLEARRRLQQEADAEFDGLGRSSSGGREFLDLKTIVQMHLMRERGYSPAEIEARLELKAGVVARLGRVGITSPA